MNSKATEEKSFWHRFHNLRKDELPVQSNFYQFLENYYKLARSRGQKIAEKFENKTLPAATLNFYNEQFDEIAEKVNLVMSDQSVDPQLRAKAKKAYKIHLGETATVRDLLDIDVFGDKTINQDIPVRQVARGINSEDRSNFDFRLNTYHFILHRPQVTEFMFLHEIIVSYLGNVIQCKGEIADRSRLDVNLPVYWTLPAYTLTALADLLGQSEAQVVSLHFASNNYARRALTPFVKELMLMSSHIFWYLDVFSNLNSFGSPGICLGYIYYLFIIPMIERQKRFGNFRLAPDAGKIADRLLIKSLIESPRANESDLRQAIVKLVDEVWVRRTDRNI